MLARVIDSASRREQEKKAMDEMRKERAAKVAASKKAPKLSPAKVKYENPTLLLEKAKDERVHR